MVEELDRRGGLLEFLPQLKSILQALDLFFPSQSGFSSFVTQMVVGAHPCAEELQMWQELVAYHVLYVNPVVPKESVHNLFKRVRCFNRVMFFALKYVRQ